MKLLDHHVAGIGLGEVSVEILHAEMPTAFLVCPVVVSGEFKGLSVLGSFRSHKVLFFDPFGIDQHVYVDTVPVRSCIA